YSSLHGEFPGLKGAVLNLNTDRGNFIWGPLFKTLSGKNSLKEKLGNFTFDADISSFFQVNTRQAEQLFAYAAALALKDNPKRILELYSGVGSLTAFLASGGAQIDAVEEWRPATRLLKQNMVQNGITNVSVHECSAEEAFGTLEKGYEVAVLDPPRSGCDRRVLDGLARLAPQKIVYVSCNPSTLARDIAVLDEQGYTLQKLEAFDLFPQTAHVETVACLVKA
ncbi:MAG: 23S rRNA (uracil(1939)-C(5))-methyltransferase RlmD, partial [Synergistaceae bacterium]|nr:23S rRNA (uracil(1939)-C(5))-methyltransferase RlmD [Synergistaceae bacterium]